VSPNAKRVIVLGGSLHRAPNGKLCTIQTTSVSYPSPNAVQEIWSNVTTRRYPRAWDGIEPDGALVIWWSDLIKLSCGRCGRSFGGYVAYHAGKEYGVVENTTRRYYPRENFAARPESTRTRLSPARRRFSFSGEVGHRASKTLCHFRCSHCSSEQEYNLARLGRWLFERPTKAFKVGVDRLA
jgi:hypothetical protein